MNIGIIGAGNMGGAIARGIAAGSLIPTDKIAVSSTNQDGELDALKADCPLINTSTDNALAAKADLIIIAVKPWILDKVLTQITPMIDFSRQAIISIVAGATLEHIAAFAPKDAKPTIFRLIPNIAITVHQSMTFISPLNASDDQLKTVCNLFSELGKVMVVEERLMAAGTALASCGIAYVMRYVRAASEGGVELGFRADQAKDVMLQTLIGAVKMLEATGNNPEVDIDKVTTPGGLTIKGLNTMERFGFTTAVIEGLKASL